MFRNRKTVDSTERVDGRAGPAPDDRPDAVAYRTWYGPTRALTTLLGAAGALVLIWIATQIRGDEGNPSYWAMVGLVALAGLVMAFSQLLGGWTKFGVPRISGNVLLLAFVPTLVVTGWILLAHQPDSDLFRNDIRGWSDDLGLLGLVMDFENLLPALAFLTGLTFGLSFDTSGPRTRTTVPARGRYADDETTVTRRTDGPVAVPAARGRYADDEATVARRTDGPVAVPAARTTRDADEPVTAERRTLDTDGDGDDDTGRGFFGRRRSRETEYSGTPTASQRDPRRTDDLD
jgi:hypothetical protein